MRASHLDAQKQSLSKHYEVTDKFNATHHVAMHL